MTNGVKENKGTLRSEKSTSIFYILCYFVVIYDLLKYVNIYLDDRPTGKPSLYFSKSFSLIYDRYLIKQNGYDVLKVFLCIEKNGS